MAAAVFYRDAKVGPAVLFATSQVAADTTAPTMTAASGTATGATTATGSVTTNEAGGTLFFLATSSATATAAAVKAGASQAVTAAGAQAVSFTGLPSASTLYPHYLHRDAAGNESAVVDGASFTTQAAADTTAPTLSAPTAAANGSNAGTGSITTNEGNGTLYFMASTNATESAATVKAGATQTIPSAGTKNVSVASLLASTLYYLHFLHRDAAGNDSAVANSGSFTTAAAADVTGPVMQGDITFTKTSTTTTVTVPAQTDPSGIGEYFFAIDGGAFVSNGTSRTKTYTGLQPLTPHLYEVLANDSLGNPSSNSLSVTVVTDAASTDPTLVSKTISVTLKKAKTLELQASIDGIYWTWSDARGEITSSGGPLSSDASAVLSVPIKTRLLSDAKGKLTLDNYNGGNPLTYFSLNAWVRVP
jgi:hypothetical protein